MRHVCRRFIAKYNLQYALARLPLRHFFSIAVAPAQSFWQVDCVERNPYSCQSPQITRGSNCENAIIRQSTTDADSLAANRAVAIFNPRGGGPLLVTCEHASRFIPPEYAGLGLSDADLERHIAWDIGALPVAQQLAQRFDSPLVHAGYSRLLLDLNRPIDAHDSVAARSEDTVIPGNVNISGGERARRQQRIYAPFHAQIDKIIAARLAARKPTAVISIHTFTPRYRDEHRPWHIGVIAQHDRRLGDALLAELSGVPSLCVGDNLPYGTQDGVFHSMERHGEAHGLPCAMLEIRNDLVMDAAGQQDWARRLHQVITAALQRIN